MGARMRMRWIVLAALAAGCGGGGGAPDAAPAADAMGNMPDAPARIDDACDVAPGAGVSFDPAGPLCDKLSSYRFFLDPDASGGTSGGALPDGIAAPNQGVVPYDINTPLFSDYTRKYRFVWLPPGTAMRYRDPASFEFPEGAVLIKNFAYAADLRQPDGPARLLETRLLYRHADGWTGVTYVWNEEQTEAYRQKAGAVIPSQWIHTDGSMRENAYSVPNENECKNCHEEQEDVLGPIGPKARHLNRELGYGAGPEDQIAHLADIGYLEDVPADLASVPRAPVWNDDGTGTLDARARAWLDINCAHCHNPTGAARTSGLDLRASQTTPSAYGVCKAPVAAGGGSGGRQFNIVPGQPDASILVYRIESTEPDVRMPEVGRQLVDEEGVALIRAWIAAMDGSCE